MGHDEAGPHRWLATARRKERSRGGIREEGPLKAVASMPAARKGFADLIGRVSRVFGERRFWGVCGAISLMFL